MPPAQRERFAQLCEHWANFAKLRLQSSPRKRGSWLNCVAAGSHEAKNGHRCCRVSFGA
jgi:hypothetical protein